MDKVKKSSGLPLSSRANVSPPGRTRRTQARLAGRGASDRDDIKLQIPNTYAGAVNSQQCDHRRALARRASAAELRVRCKMRYKGDRAGKESGCHVRYGRACPGPVLYRTRHFLRWLLLRLLRDSRAARVAFSNTSRTPSLVLAEHSRYLCAPIFLRTSSP